VEKFASKINVLAVPLLLTAQNDDFINVFSVLCVLWGKMAPPIYRFCRADSRDPASLHVALSVGTRFEAVICSEMLMKWWFP
jgi:hypothetical protein